MTCAHCGNPIPPRTRFQRGPNRKYCDESCRVASSDSGLSVARNSREPWSGDIAPELIERIFQRHKQVIRHRRAMEQGER